MLQLQVQRCKPMNALTRKSADFLHLQVEQLLGAVSDSLGQNKNVNYLANNEINYYVRYLFQSSISNIALLT